MPNMGIRMDLAMVMSCGGGLGKKRGHLVILTNAIVGVAGNWGGKMPLWTLWCAVTG